MSDGVSAFKILGGPSRASAYVDDDGNLHVKLQGANQTTVNTSLEGLNAIETTQYTVGTSAQKLTPTPMTNRSGMMIKVRATDTSQVVYVGPNDQVTSLNGFPIFDGDTLQLDLKETQEIWAIGSAAGQKVFVLEIGG